MTRMHTATRIVGVLGAAIMIAGCGGGEEVVDPAASPTPGAEVPGAVAGDPASAVPAVDPVTGLPVDPALAGAAGGDVTADATVPDLSGDDLSAGLAAIGGTPIFDAKAVKSDKLAEDTVADDTTAPAQTMTEAPTEAAPEAPTATKAAPKYTGAKIYVNGITHDVNRNGTFPKGDPVFKLLSVTATSIEVDLIAGEFTTSGGTGTFLDKGELVSALNASEQITYKVKYLRPIVATDSIGF